MLMAHGYWVGSVTARWLLHLYSALSFHPNREFVT